MQETVIGHFQNTRGQNFCIREIRINPFHS